MRDTLALLAGLVALARLILANIFWPARQVHKDFNDNFDGNGTVEQEFDKDKHFIGSARAQLHLLFELLEMWRRINVVATCRQLRRTPNTSVGSSGLFRPKAVLNK